MSLILPTVSLLLLAGFVTVGSANEAATASRLVKLADMSSASAELASALSQERTAAALNLIGGGDQTAAAELFKSATAHTDAAAQTWKEQIAAADGVHGITADALARAQQLTAGLGEVRAAVRSSAKTVLSVLVLRYRLMIAGLLDVQLSLIVAGAPSQIADRLRALAALSQAAESAGLQQVAVLRAIAGGKITQASAGLIASARSGYAEALQIVDTAGDRSWRAWLDQALSGEEILAAQRLEGLVSRTEVGDIVPVKALEWAQSQQIRQVRLRDVGRRAEGQVAGQLAAWRDQVRQDAILTAGAATTVLIIALWLGWFLARRMSRSLETLRAGAMSIAKTGLPNAVALMASRGDLASIPAEIAADQAATPLPVRGRDEVAQVAGSFNAVQLAALRLAAEQAQARQRVAAMFLTVGLSQQTKLAKLMSTLDILEKEEQDPERLAALFDVDHLTTRMSRGNARLMLLAGAPLTSSQSAPASIHDVLLAAMSRLDDYQRVELADIDLVLVRPEAVDGVVLALAELLDNACRFASSKVVVAARFISDHVTVLINDEGVGMTPSDLAGANALLASGGQLSVPALRSMGLAAVARVAAVHGLNARLSANIDRGITAELVLPPAVVTLPIRTGQPDPESVMALRQERRGETGNAGLRWPTGSADSGEGEGPQAELPSRRRKVAATQGATDGQVQRRDPSLRQRELSSMQAGIRMAQAARISTKTRWEE